MPKKLLRYMGTDRVFVVTNGGVLRLRKSVNEDREIEGKVAVGFLNSRKGKEVVQHG